MQTQPFLYHSIVGDDWTIAASITIGIAVTFCWLVQSNIQVWWLLASCANRMAALSSFRGLAYAVVQLNRSALVLSIGNRRWRRYRDVGNLPRAVIPTPVDDSAA